MIHISLLFWAALALPGYAVLCRLDRDQLKSGLLGTLGLSYLGTFALLSPISILCYVLHLPVAVFAVACVVLVVAGAVEVTRRRWWRNAWTLVVGALGLELLFVVADLVLSARVGTVLGGDALVHLARIRQLLDHGLTNSDPFFADNYFFSIYHTNLLHALCAACSWITRIDHLGVWHAGLPFSKVLVASGCYYLTWCVFERRWVAWVAVLFFLYTQGPVTFLLYPNKLAPFWLLPMMIGLALRATHMSCRPVNAIWLGAAALVLGQIHGLYVLFALMLLGPLLMGSVIVGFVRRHSNHMLKLACLAVLLVGLPFPLVTKLTTRTEEGGGKVSAAKAQAKAQSKPKLDRKFVRLDNGLVMRRPFDGFGACLGGVRGARYWLLAGAIAGALWTRRRPTAARAAAVIGTTAAILYFPPLCSVLVAATGGSWMLARLEAILFVSFAVMVPSLLAYLIESRTRYWWVRAILSAAAFGAAIPYYPQKPPYDWSTYIKKAGEPAENRRQVLTNARQLGTFLRKHIPPGETVLVKESRGTGVVVLLDCYILAPKRGSVGVPGAELWRRRRDRTRLLAAETVWEKRRELLNRYDIRYYVPMEPCDWVHGHLETFWRTKENGPVVVKLKTD